MNYFLLFCICFLPLLSFRWTRVPDLPITTTTTTTNPSKPPAPLPPPPPPPASPGAVSRVVSSLFLRKKTKPPPSPSASFFQQPLQAILANNAAKKSWFSPPSKKKTPASRPPPSPPPPPPPLPVLLPSPPPVFIRPPVPTSHHYAVARADADEVVTMTAFLGTEGSNVDVDLVVLMTHLQAACKHVASILASPTELQTTYAKADFVFGVGRDAPKPLAVVSNNIIKAALRSSGKVAAIASEEDERPLWLGEGPYVVVFDPLDGSRNIDASVPSGTIFGIYRRLQETDYLPTEEKAYANVMQRGERMVAAGYALYSSSTIMAISVGSGLHGFSLDYTIGEFVYSHHDIRIPERGQIYSVNDAKYYDWPSGLRRYIDNVRQGKGQTRKFYSARFMCSLVADLHRTIMYGGITLNPRPHVKLMYESNPLSYLVEQGGGKGTDGTRRILEINPIEIHQKLPLFLGSAADVSELVSYGDIQQVQRNPSGGGGGGGGAYTA